MTDYISRQALMKEFADFVRRPNNSDFAETPTWNDAVSLAGSMPAAPVREVKRGRWMAIGNTGLAACECGFITDRYSIYSYCPNCGSDNRGKE